MRKPQKPTAEANIQPAAGNGRAGDARPLGHDELRDVNDLALWAGQLLLQHGAETARVEETVKRMATGLGSDWADVLVSPNAIIMTTVSGSEFRTRIRRVTSIGVNMRIIANIMDLSRAVAAGDYTREQVRGELQRIADKTRRYNRWLVALMVGLACGAFSRLADGDWIIFGITTVSATVAMVVRQELAHRHFNQFLIVVTTAFVAGLLASSANLFGVGDQPAVALASSVLLLVPGVPLITAVEDMLDGHYVTALVRGMTAILFLVGIALGLLLAMQITGLQRV